MAPATALARRSLDPAKFRDPDTTAKGERRASVALHRLRTLWFNTGSLCNIECQGCYIESGPRNDRLAYLELDEVRGFLDEIAAARLPAEEIGFTGGEPFMNRDLPDMLDETLARGFRALVLTNAMKPMWHKREHLAALRDRHGAALSLRVSMDHFTPDRHEAVRGPNTWEPMMRGLRWLTASGFDVAIAGRQVWDEPEDRARAGYAELFRRHRIAVDADDPTRLVLFPDMDDTRDVPEITESCWGILNVDPATMMCADQRMVLKRKGAERPVVVPCTLLPYDPGFDMGASLAEAAGPVKLNHPHCATFCVLGGASCSAQG